MESSPTPKPGGLMAAFKESRIRTKLLILQALFLGSFLAFGALAWNTMHAVQINGPYYKNIVQSKDVIADILPPPNT